MNNAVVSYLDTHNNKMNSQNISARLNDALKKYQINYKLKNLHSVYSHYLSYEDKLQKSRVNTDSMINAFKTFNISPSNSYERYLSVLNNRTDTEALHSDWEMVGEDLTLSWVKFFLENGEMSEQGK